MKEAAITKSPYAYEPREVLTKEEKEKLYRLRIDETFRAYTVFDVLTKVYHRSFSDDLIVYLGAHPEEFREFEAGWKLSRAWVNELTVIRSESVFFQPVDNFRVDILVEARIKMEESKKQKLTERLLRSEKASPKPDRAEECCLWWRLWKNCC